MTIIKLPVKTPALPSPAIALPTMRAIELGASPHISDPISKMPMAIRYDHFSENKRYTRP